LNDHSEYLQKENKELIDLNCESEDKKENLHFAQENHFIDEDRSFGAVRFVTFLKSIQAMGGILSNLFIMITAFSNASLETYTVFLFLTYAENLTPSTKTTNALLIISVCLVFVSIGGIRGFAVAMSSAFASRRIHSKMSFSFLHCKINEFLERVPQGRIINRFSEDVETVDTTIATNINGVYLSLSFVIVSSGMIITTGGSLWLILPCCVVFIVGVYIRGFYMGLKREVVRLKRISKTPITSCISQALNGMVELRAHKKQSYTMINLQRLADENNKNNLMIFGLDCWFNIMILNSTILIVNIPSFLFVIWTIYSDLESVDFRFTVLFLMNITSLARYLLGFLNYYCLVESDLISVERCLSFVNIKPENGYRDLKKNRKLFEFPSKQTITKIVRLESNQSIFPHGDVHLDKVTAKYPQSNRNVLEDICLHVKPGEKIGVVGRTGAGKTSFIKLFWRGLEIESGSIKVDARELGDQELTEVRREIMVVSQETALFAGTLRENIDPKLQYSMNRKSLEFKQKEESIIHILLEMGFDRNRINREGLDFIIAANGENLSLGERQMISFVRAIVADKKLIILDEATASVDLKTEEMIQNLIDRHFKQKTLILIAHRIQTILKCDKILVLEQGKVAEFDTIENLLKIENGRFKKLYNKFKEHV